MLFLKIISFCLGLCFALFGFFIFFKKKYSLINGFDADFKAGRKTEAYAKGLGLIEFIIGIAILIAFIFLILFV